MLGHWGSFGRLYNRSIIIIYCCPLLSILDPQIIGLFTLLISNTGGLQSHFEAEKHNLMYLSMYLAPVELY